MTTDHTKEERDRILSKIKKCLALSRSPEPHEAAAAMRQAQKMMSMLGITAEEAAAPEIESAVVKTREGFGRCLYMNHLVNVINKTFGVTAIYEANPGTAARLNVRYVGARGRVQLAEYTHKVIQRAVDDAWGEHLSTYPLHKGDGGKRTAFRLGWLRKVQAQVESMAVTDPESKAIERWKDSYYGGTLVKGKPIVGRPLDPRLMAAGAEAARDFALHRPMGSDRLKIGHDK